MPNLFREFPHLALSGAEHEPAGTAYALRDEPPATQGALANFPLSPDDIDRIPGILDGIREQSARLAAMDEPIRDAYFRNLGQIAS